MKEKTLREHCVEAGKARWKGVSKEERTRIAKNAVNQRPNVIAKLQNKK